MTILFRRAPVWILVNLIGMGVYLRLASEIWVRPGDEGLPGGPGDPFYWTLCLLPFLAFCLAFNLLAPYVILKCTPKTRKLSSVGIWSAIAMLWIVTNTYDNHRAFRIICPAERQYLVDGECVASVPAASSSYRTPE